MTTLLLTLAATVFLAATFYHRPSWGLFTVVLLLPFERIGSYILLPHTGHPVVRIVQVAGAALVLTYMARLLTGREKFSYQPSYKYLAGTALVSLVPLWQLRYSQLNRNYLIGLGLFVLFAAVSQLITTERLRTVQLALFGSAGAVACFGIYQYVGDILGLPASATGLRAAYTKAVFGFPRIQATALEPLYYANYLLIPVLVGLSIIIVHGKKAPRLLMPVIGLLLLNLALTMSRGGIFAALAGCLVLIALLHRDVRKLSSSTLRKFGLTVLLILILTLSATAGASKLYYGNATKGPVIFLRLFTTQLTHTGSFTERHQTQGQARAIFLKHPLFGVGIGGFGPALLNYPAALTTENWPTANNAFWELLAELGVVGFMLLSGFVLSIGISAYRTLQEAEGIKRAWVAGLLAALVAIIIQYQSFTGFFLTHIWICMALLAGLATGKHTGKSRLRGLYVWLRLPRINTMRTKLRATILALLAISLVFTPLREFAYIIMAGHIPHLALSAFKYGLELVPIACLGLAVATYYPELRGRGKLPLVIVLCLVILAWATLSIFIGQAPTWQGFRGLRADFSGLLGFLTIWIVVPKRKEVKRILLTIVGLFGFLMFFGTIEFFFNHSFRVWAHQDLLRHFVGKIPQIRSFTPGPNPFGSLLAIAAALALTFFSGKRRFIAVIPVGIFLGLTQARSAWLATAVLGLGLFISDARKKQVNWPVLVLGFSILIGSSIGVLQYHESLRMVLLHGESTNEHADITSSNVVSTVKRRAPDLIIGSGIGTAGPVTFATSEEVVISENWYIQITQELGLIGLALYMAFIFIAIRTAFREGTPVVAWLGVGLTFNAMFLHTWSSDFSLNMVFWTLLGLALFAPEFKNVSLVPSAARINTA